MRLAEADERICVHGRNAILGNGIHEKKEFRSHSRDQRPIILIRASHGRCRVAGESENSLSNADLHSDPALQYVPQHDIDELVGGFRRAMGDEYHRVTPARDRGILTNCPTDHKANQAAAFFHIEVRGPILKNAQ